MQQFTQLKEEEEFYQSLIPVIVRYSQDNVTIKSYVQEVNVPLQYLCVQLLIVALQEP